MTITGEKLDELRRLANAAKGAGMYDPAREAFFDAASPDVILALLDRASSPARSAEGGNVNAPKVRLPEGVELGEFKPCVIYYEEGDFSQMLLEDCPTVTGWPMVLVEPLFRMGDRELVGFQWNGKKPTAAQAALTAKEPSK